jgi:parvulin-like peptidyl-prolyl isomerase
MTSKSAIETSSVARRARSAFPWLPLAATLAAMAGIGMFAWWAGWPAAASAQSPRTSSPPRNPAASSGANAPLPANRSAAGKSAVQQAAATGARTAQPADVVAVVNSEQITREQLNQECLRRFGDDEVARAAGKFGLSAERFLAMLKEERDISPDQYRREITWPTLALRHLVAGQIEITDQELQESFESEYGPQVKVRLIAATTRAQAEQILREVAAQPDRFGDIAKEKSADPNSAATRGQIPPIRKHVGHPEVERVAFSLKEGAISPVIAVASDQYLILKCEKQLPESYVSPTQMTQIKAKLRDQIHDNKMRSAAAALFQRLQGQARIVNVFNDPSLSSQMPGVAVQINDGQVTVKQLAEECTARHGKDVLEGEINRKLLEQELRRRNRTVTQQAVDAEIARAAEAYGFIKPDRTPDIEGWVKAVTETEQVSIDLYIRDSVWPSVALKTIVGDVVQVTPDDLQKGFESNYGERVEVLAIVLGNQREAQRIWELARANPTDQFFGELAQQHSLEPVSRSNFGKVPPIRKFGGQPLLEEEAFRLQAGEMSGIVAVGDKFVILRCLGRTKPVVTDRESVASELRDDIREKKLRIAMAEEFDRLREAAQIDNYLTGTVQSGNRTSPRPGAASRNSNPITSPGSGAMSPAPRGVAPAKVALPPAGNPPARR